MRWSGDYDKLLSFGEEGFQLWSLSTPEGTGENLALLGQQAARIYPRTNDNYEIFDRRFVQIGPIYFEAISSFIPFDFLHDGKMDLLTIGHYSDYLGFFTETRAYQKERFDGMELWRKADWISVPHCCSGVTDYKAQLVDIDRNGLFEYIFVIEPYGMFVQENPDTAFGAPWQPKYEVLLPFLTQRDTIYFDPSFADLDGDEDLDLLVLQKDRTSPEPKWAGYLLFENQLGGDTIIWRQRDDWLVGLEDSTHSHSNFADLDDDGDADLVFGTHGGTLLAFENIGSRNVPAWRRRDDVFSGIDVGQDAAPSFGDIDHDGRPDLFVGNRSGDLFYYRNDTRLNATDRDSAIPRRGRLHQNYPNPFNARTVIRYEIPQDEHVKMEIYDLLGRPISTLMNQRQSAGSHEVIWEAGATPSGVYLLRLSLGRSEFRTERMLVIR